VPKGERWIHEIKFDGYRVQLHIANESTTVFTRNGSTGPGGSRRSLTTPS
jgi:ATP-dependent DNA ligase